MFFSRFFCMIISSKCFQIEQHDPVSCLSGVIRMHYNARPHESTEIGTGIDTVRRPCILQRTDTQTLFTDTPSL